MKTLFLKQSGRFFEWGGRIEKTGRFAWSLPLADALLYGAVLVVYAGYGLGRTLDGETIALLATGVVLFHLLCLGYSWSSRENGGRQLIKTVGASALAFFVLPPAFPYLQIDLSRHAFAVVVAAGTLLQLLLHLAHQRWRRQVPAAPLEPLRWMLLGTSGVLLSLPLLTNSKMGTGDAYWYGSMIADFVTQWRAGIFPVFVGQSDFAFNGAINPVRFAPYLQHAAGILDLLTWHALSFFGLVNLTLALSVTAAAFTAYATLVAAGKGRRWLACMLALLFVGSPAVLSLLYTGDLFLSVCVLPYLPLVMYGIWRTFHRRDSRSVCFLAAALAATWWCHPPIAFWATVIAALSQLVRLATEGPSAALVRGWFVGALLFAALSAGVFVSALGLHLPAPPTRAILVARSLASVFPGALLPVSDRADLLSDYQLGWSLWFMLLAAGIATGVRRDTFRVALLAGAGLLLLLLLPIPPVENFLWGMWPEGVRNLTNVWPMQRFYVLLAILTVFLGLGAAPLLPRRIAPQIALGILLLAALLWSGWEAGGFVRSGARSVASATESRVMHLPQNRILTRFAYGPFPDLPAYFSHGYVDPLWENRLLEPGTFRELASNYTAIPGAATIGRSEGEITARRYSSRPDFHELLAALPIEPGRRYALEFDTVPPDLTGTLLIIGPTVAHQYDLPDSGAGVNRPRPSTAFGTLPTSRRALPLMSSAGETEKLLVQFVSTGDVARDLSHFGHFILREYDPARLPVVVESWTPYRARIAAPARAWLETPRIYIDGYRALVNGRPVPVAPSPDGLVMLPVEAGESRVTLDYPGPLVLRLGYFLSLATWLAWLAAGGCRLAGPGKSATAA